MTPKTIQRNYLILTLLNTLSASFIWGVNTLFLLDAGLTKTEAFAANAFFTVGQVLFEIPTGVIADTLGRRTSYLLGSATLILSTLLYLYLWNIKADFWAWALVSAFLGLGFTFFSGAVEAWLIDALQFTKFSGSTEDVFAKGQIVAGMAMLIGSVFGGFVAEQTNLGVPYIVRAVVLGLSFLVAFVLMRDVGFQPRRMGNVLQEMKTVLLASVDGGLRIPSVRWMMLVGPFMFGVSFYGFYAAQPYLLELYGDEKAYGVAGIAAALAAGSQIAGGFMVPYIRRIFKRRSTVLAFIITLSFVSLLVVGTIQNFWFAIIFFGIWSMFGSALVPIRQAYLNASINSSQRATILSFDGMIGSSGGAIVQPILGKSADVWGYPGSFVIGSGIQLLALPFVFLVRREKAKADYGAEVEKQA